MRRIFSTVLSLAVGLSAAAVPLHASAQAASAGSAPGYPAKPIRLVVPFPPGGSADAAARPLSEKMTPLLGQPLVIDNKGGGLTVVGADIVAKAPADGYTLFVMPGTHVLSPLLVNGVSFHPIRDFTPVGMIATIPYVFYSDTRQPFTTMRELIAHARANPGKVSVGTTDALSRLAVESLNNAAKIQLVNVSYKGAPQLATDVVGGHIQVGVITPPSILAFYKDKRIRALGITGPSKLTAMPDVPTVAEASGVADFSIQTWFALAGPGNLPRPLVTQLQQNLQKVLADRDMRERLVNSGMEPTSDTATDKALAFIQSEHDRMGKMIQAAGIKPE